MVGPAMDRTLVIWVLGDGKPGHENQSLGLTEALGRLVSCQVRRIAVGELGALERLAVLRRFSADGKPPDLVVGAGHATHWGLLMLAHQHRARSVVLMKPSLPLRWFDLCLVPEHDFAGRRPGANVVTTLGALNRVRAGSPKRPRGGLLLVGGPSATHDWDAAGTVARLVEITAGAATGEWRLTTSRRTPPDMVPALRRALPKVKVFSHDETDREWLPTQLARAGAVWVTEDSVSMIYEALSSGARVGLLPVPRKTTDSRVLRGLAGLVERGFVTPYDGWLESRTLVSPPHVLGEADRCAGEVLDRLFS